MASEFQRKPFKVEGLPVSPGSGGVLERRRAHRLLYGFLRWRDSLRKVIEPWLKRRPRPRLEALLLLAAYELADARASARPAIVHHAVGLAKRHLSMGEARLANAILRRFADLALTTADLSNESAHPSWLVERWRGEFGNEATEELLEWNQREPKLYACREGGDRPPDSWKPTPWPSYFDVTDVPWPELQAALSARRAYIQDPFARHPVELMAPAPGEVILDGCAAPGGKSRGLLRAWSGGGQLIAVDLPGPRLARLRENLDEAGGAVKVTVFPADLTTLTAGDLVVAGIPTEFDGVLIDAPCSNTGVLARRPDVRYHLTPEQIRELSLLQGTILATAARLVRAGGRLVYSTCSLESEENEAVVDAFLAAHPDFVLRESRPSRPWIDAHDGGGAFLLTRVGPGK